MPAAFAGCGRAASAARTQDTWYASRVFTRASNFKERTGLPVHGSRMMIRRIADRLARAQRHAGDAAQDNGTQGRDDDQNGLLVRHLTLLISVSAAQG